MRECVYTKLTGWMNNYKIIFFIITVQPQKSETEATNNVYYALDAAK